MCEQCTQSQHFQQSIKTVYDIEHFFATVEVLQKIEMTTIRKFCCNDLLRFSSVNLDHLTPNERIFHYETLFIKWSNYCHVAIAPGNRIIGYIIGVNEQNLPDGDKGQVIAVSVVPEYRRLGIATELMQALEKQLVLKISSFPRGHDYYVFLYVGVYNSVAKSFFRKIGFKTVKTMPKFFPQCDDEDANRMSKVLQR